jgi:hypothetical protein
MSNFANIKPGQYFVTDASEVERAVRHFKGEELLAMLTQINPKYGETAYHYSTNLVAELETVEYPRIIGLQFDHLGHVEIVFSFGLLDTINLTANFTQRGYS